MAPHITADSLAPRLALRPATDERQSLTTDLPLSPAVQRILTDTTQGPTKVEDLIRSLLREDAAAL